MAGLAVRGVASKGRVYCLEAGRTQMLLQTVYGNCHHLVAHLQFESPINPRDDHIVALVQLTQWKLVPVWPVIDVIGLHETLENKGRRILHGKEVHGIPMRQNCPLQLLDDFL